MFVIVSAWRVRVRVRERERERVHVRKERIDAPSPPRS